MRVYSVYLSTLTGSSVKSTFNAITFSQALVTSAAASTTSTITLSAAATITVGSIVYFQSDGYANQSFVVVSGASAATTFVIDRAVNIPASTNLYVLVQTPSALTTSMFVTSIISGALPLANQFLVMNGIVNKISSITGNVITLSLSTTQEMASIYLSYTQSSVPPKYAPSNKNLGQALSNMKFTINWNEIFGNRARGEMRVRAILISAPSTLLSWANNIGSLRISLSSNTSNMTNGLNVGFVRPQSDYTSQYSSSSYSTASSYISLDTLQANGISTIIPNTNGDFYINILDNSEANMANIPEYNLFLYFDADDEMPYIPTVLDGAYDFTNPR